MQLKESLSDAQTRVHLPKRFQLSSLCLCSFALRKIVSSFRGPVRISKGLVRGLQPNMATWTALFSQSAAMLCVKELSKSKQTNRFLFKLNVPFPFLLKQQMLRLKRLIKKFPCRNVRSCSTANCSQTRSWVTDTTETTITVSAHWVEHFETFLKFWNLTLLPEESLAHLHFLTSCGVFAQFWVTQF